MVAEALQHVADIDDDGVGLGGERHPLALARQHFQTGGAGAHQQGDEIDVLVRAGTHVRDIVGRDRRVMDGAQDGIAVVGLVGEIVFGQIDVQGQRRQHARAQRIERFVQLVGVALELGHFLRPEVRRHHARVFRTRRQLAADVVELLQVEMLGILRRLDAEGRVAAGAAAARHVVFALGLFRQGEEGLEGLVGAIDELRRNSMSADAAEAPLAVGGAELGNEGRAFRVETADIQAGNLTHGVIASNGSVNRLAQPALRASASGRRAHHGG